MSDYFMVFLSEIKNVLKINSVSYCVLLEAWQTSQPLIFCHLMGTALSKKGQVLPLYEVGYQVSDNFYSTLKIRDRVLTKLSA